MINFYDNTPPPLETKLDRLFEGIPTGDIVSSSEKKAIATQERAFHEVEARWTSLSPEAASRRFHDAQGLAVTNPTRENCEALAAMGTRADYLQAQKLRESAAYLERKGMCKSNMTVTLPVLKKIAVHLENRLVILREDIARTRHLITGGAHPIVWKDDQIVLSFEKVAFYLHKLIERIESNHPETTPQSPVGIIKQFIDLKF